MILLDAERRGICHSRENGNPDWIPDRVGDDMYPNDASVEELDLKRKLIRLWRSQSNYTLIISREKFYQPGVAEWPIALDCKSNGAILRGFESLPLD